MRHCIFCNELLPGNQAKEHVLPRWLEREINLPLRYYDHSIEGDTGSGFAIASESIFSGTPSTRVEGRVCKKCNNEWLSSLEVQAKPFISELVFGRRSLKSLDKKERLLVATWLYKTLLVGISSGNGEFDIHPCDFHTFRAVGLPGNWLNIYAAVLDSSCAGFCGPVELKWNSAGNTESQKTEMLGLKWSFHIGKLHAVFCHSAIDNATQVIIGGYHQPLWTPQQFRIARKEFSPELENNALLQWLAFGLTPALEWNVDSSFIR